MTKNKSNSRNLVLFTLAILIIFILLFVVTQMTKKTDGSSTMKNKPDIASQPLMGNKDAKVTIVEFGDYKCPSCKAWGEQIFPKLQKDYVDTGKANFSYINTLFHGDESKLGALAGESIYAKNPDEFWNIHKAIFNAQPAVDHDSLWITPEKLLELAKTNAPKIDLKALEDDLKNQSFLSQVSLDEKLVKQFNVQKTPTIMVNDVMITNPFDYKTISAIIDKELGK